MSSILSPYGEGYCRHCRFIIGLDASGRLDKHIRGPVAASWDVSTRKACKGGGRAPAKVTPYYSRLSMFRTRAKKDYCRGCQQQISIRHDGTFELHATKDYVRCPGSLWTPDASGRVA
jgi:hypothetical protein